MRGLREKETKGMEGREANEARQNLRITKNCTLRSNLRKKRNERKNNNMKLIILNSSTRL